MQKKNDKKTKATKPASKKKTVLPKPLATKAEKKTAAKAPHYLFSIPSAHTQDNDYEHLVIAPDGVEACRLLAEHRVTEKRPELEGAVRAKLVELMMNGYTHRPVTQIEARKEAAGVVAINHHKLGLSSESVH